MKYELDPLPYAYDALEPFIDARTMEVHYAKHHQAYLNKLNEALDKYPALYERPIETLLSSLESVPEDIQTSVKNNGGGYYNHARFWTFMKKDPYHEPSGEFADAIARDFGTFSDFKNIFSQAAIGHFGSGWTWLWVDLDKKLMISSTPNQDTPLNAGIVPILGVDLWEHAYYLKYQNRRNEYIEAWWNVVDWEAIERNYARELERINANL